MCVPGVLAVEGPKFRPDAQGKDSGCDGFVEQFSAESSVNRFPLIVIVDDSEFTARQLKNFLWVVFTRSNPASDLYGVDSFTENKHWGCRGSLVIDARIKPNTPMIKNEPMPDRSFPIAYQRLIGHSFSLKMVFNSLIPSLKSTLTSIEPATIDQTIAALQMQNSAYGLPAGLAELFQSSSDNPSAAKAAMIGMSRSLAIEVAKHGITVNNVAPGWIATGSSTAAEHHADIKNHLSR